jgi:hypothetical protein
MSVGVFIRLSILTRLSHPKEINSEGIYPAFNLALVV